MTLFQFDDFKHVIITGPPQALQWFPCSPQGGHKEGTNGLHSASVWLQ